MGNRRGARGPLHLEIYAEIKRGVLSGDMPPGTVKTSAAPRAKITVEGLRHRYRGADTRRAVLALDNVAFEVLDGEILTVVGPTPTP